MALLFDEDYEALAARDLAIDEDEDQRVIVFTDYSLVPGLYTTPTCDVLVVIPPDYNQAGNDMLWTFPRLVRADGRPIPRSTESGSNHNRQFRGKDFCRWSRHWHPGQPGAWRAGVDDIISIQRRIDWALANPDC